MSVARKNGQMHSSGYRVYKIDFRDFTVGPVFQRKVLSKISAYGKQGISAASRFAARGVQAISRADVKCLQLAPEHVLLLLLLLLLHLLFFLLLPLLLKRRKRLKRVLEARKRNSAAAMNEFDDFFE